MKRILKSLDGERLKESWFWDRDELIDQRNEINKKLRLLDKERKQQPALIVKSNFGDDVYYINQYKVTQTSKDLLIYAESKRVATEDDIRRIEAPPQPLEGV